MIVTVSGLSGLTNAYTSVLSATGSLLISGASLCDDIQGPPLERSWSAGGVEQALDEHRVSVGRFARPRHHGHLSALCVAHVRRHRFPRGGTRGCRHDGLGLG